MADTTAAEPMAPKPDEPNVFEVVVEKRSPAAAGEFEVFPEEPEEEEIKPAYYYEDMGIPVFKPTMDQFRSFKHFVDKINHYGMQSGIVKIIPPAEWHETQLHPLDEKVKDIRIKNPIVQHIAGMSGEFRQTNLEKQRTYSLPQWRQLCEASDHQPPAKRGERRRGQVAKDVLIGKKPRPKRGATKKEKEEEDEDDIIKMGDAEVAKGRKQNPPTPNSPENIKAYEVGTPEPATDAHGRQPRVKSEATPDMDVHGRQPRPKKKYIRKSAKVREAEREIAEEDDWRDFDYRIQDADGYTPERCEELEKAYWRTLTYNNPLYGADMPGSLFDDRTTSWNVAKLENLLDCLGKKLPGVNTAYLYLGMWKSTFAWHLEDVDLYSINYIHFGAPKQWYSISREDKPKFEQVMKSIWPSDAKKCGQFLRHKTYLVSPSLLAANGIKVNRLVHHEGEFVITFPFGYHSGYNLGYNCAESVNFATESWLEFARDAKKCECVGDSVWVDVEEIERKLRGDVTEDEYEEVWSEDDSDEEDEEGGRAGAADLPTPPESVDEGKAVKAKRSRKRKSEGDAGGQAPRAKRLKLKFSKTPAPEPCVLCPNNIPSEELLATDNGQKAHRLCAIYTPETFFQWDREAQQEIIANVDSIPKARLDLKCVFCRSKKGACFQCSAKKCTRAYHATCAAAAGVLVNMVDITVLGADGLMYPQTDIDFRCRFHRPKRHKDMDGEKLEEDPLIRSFARDLIKGDVIQMQFYKGDIFAGVVMENRRSEEMVVVDLLPKGDTCEIEWKWILAQDPATAQLPPPLTEVPLHPTSQQAGIATTKLPKDIPEMDDPFCDKDSGLTWAELVIEAPPKNEHQMLVDPAKPFWYYLGEQSTEYIPKYTSDPRKRVPDDAAILITPRKPRPKVFKVPASRPQKPTTIHQQPVVPTGLFRPGDVPPAVSRPHFQHNYMPYQPGHLYGRPSPPGSYQAPVAPMMGAVLPTSQPPNGWPAARPSMPPSAPTAAMGPIAVPPPVVAANTTMEVNKNTVSSGGATGQKMAPSPSSSSSTGNVKEAGPKPGVGKASSTNQSPPSTINTSRINPAIPTTTTSASPPPTKQSTSSTSSSIQQPPTITTNPQQKAPPPPPTTTKPENKQPSPLPPHSHPPPPPPPPPPPQQTQPPPKPATRTVPLAEIQAALAKLAKEAKARSLLAASTNSTNTTISNGNNNNIAATASSTTTAATAGMPKG